MENIKLVKELRVSIDGLANTAKQLKPIFVKTGRSLCGKGVSGYYDYSPETKTSIDNLFLAKAWLGKVLAELGSENPYGSGYETKEDIEPTADTADITADLSEMNHVQKVDWVRGQITELVDKLPETNPGSRKEAIAWTNTYNYLCEARFWLGFELERIKNN